MPFWASTSIRDNRQTSAKDVQTSSPFDRHSGLSTPATAAALHSVLLLRASQSSLPSTPPACAPTLVPHESPLNNRVCRLLHRNHVGHQRRPYFQDKADR